MSANTAFTLAFGFCLGIITALASIAALGLDLI